MRDGAETRFRLAPCDITRLCGARERIERLAISVERLRNRATVASRSTRSGRYVEAQAPEV